MNVRDFIVADQATRRARKRRRPLFSEERVELGLAWIAWFFATIGFVFTMSAGFYYLARLLWP